LFVFTERLAGKGKGGRRVAVPEPSAPSVAPGAALGPEARRPPHLSTVE
jgi:hypothetical protein